MLRFSSITRISFLLLPPDGLHSGLGSSQQPLCPG